MLQGPASVKNYSTRSGAFSVAGRELDRKGVEGLILSGGLMLAFCQQKIGFDIHMLWVADFLSR